MRIVSPPSVCDQLLVDDVDDLLRRVQRLVELDPDAPLPDPGDQPADDLEVDVGLEQGQADLAQDLVDIVLAEAAAPAHALEDPVEAVRQCLEHEGAMLPGPAGWQSRARAPE